MVQKIGKFGAIFNKNKFTPYIKKSDVVLDFGCGGGYLLNNIECAEKYGLEINEVAIEKQKKNLKYIKKQAIYLKTNLTSLFLIKYYNIVKI